MSNTEDLALASRCALFDDRKAFARLVDKYQPGIKRFFLNLTLGDRMQSDDLAQETFIKVYYHIKSFKGLSGFSTWLYRIAYNIYFDAVRANKQTGYCDLKQAESITACANTSADDKIDIFQSLNILREDERTAILLFYMEDMSINKIAAIMNCPNGTVKSHLSRGKVKLGAFLKHEGYGK